MNYQVMQQVEGKNFIPALHNRTKQPLVYPNAAMAKRVAVRLTKMKGVKCQPRPVVDADAWKLREQQRFADGRYKPMIWAGQGWWDKHHNPDHFAHVSIKDPTQVAFTKDAKNGSADIQTAMKPGKYLTEFFGAVLTPDQIRAFAMQHSMMYEENELKFARTPEEIQEVYAVHIGGSCFSGTTKANLYGSGDFAVAYITDDNGIVKGRAVCCPERKIYVYPYGDRVRIEDLLKKAGYKRADYSESWKGLRLVKALYWNGFYTDFGSNPRPKADDKEFFTI